MHLIKPQKGRQKWHIRTRIHDGRTVRFPGDRDQVVASRIGMRIDMLVRAKEQGDPPPGELRAWIDGMPKALAEKLIEYGLVERRVVEKGKPIEEHLKEFEKVIAARKNNSARHAKIQISRLKTVFSHMEKKVERASDIEEDAFSKAVLATGLASSTRRQYIIVGKDFCKWLAKPGIIPVNPLADLKPPGQYSDPVHERQPLTVKQFQALMTYLDGAKRYPQQKTRWTPHDRKMLYWTAVKTAYRASELAALKVRSVVLDAVPAQVVLRAGDNKNKTKGAVPIPTDLATALKDYIKDRDPEEKLFPMPSVGNGLLNCFRRDLDAAGIKWNWGKDDPQTIDFHALRSTAICWWLDVDGLSAKRVQILARLKTLALVATYSRNLKLDEFGWLNNGPKLVDDSGEDKKTGDQNGETAKEGGS